MQDPTPGAPTPCEGRRRRAARCHPQEHLHGARAGTPGTLGTRFLTGAVGSAGGRLGPRALRCAPRRCPGPLGARRQRRGRVLRAACPALAPGLIINGRSAAQAAHRGSRSPQGPASGYRPPPLCPLPVPAPLGTARAPRQGLAVAMEGQANGTLRPSCVAREPPYSQELLQSK